MKYIGIDPGKKTGFAVWDHDARYLAEVDTMSITQAMEKVRMMADDDYLEKLERGECDHIEDNIEMVGRITPYRDVTNQVELITPFDDDYWRKLYAGMAMQGFCRENGTMNPASMVANVSVECADALIAELKKEKK